MIGTPLQIKNHETGNIVTLNDHSDPDNVIALQVFPTFEADVRAENLPRNGAHGEIRLPFYYSGMSIVLDGIIVGEDEASVWALKRQLDNVMRLSQEGYPKTTGEDDEFPPMFRNTLRLSFTDPTGKDVFIDASPIKQVSYDRPLKQDFLLNFQVILRANFPYLIVESETPIVESGALGSKNVGFKVPFQVPLDVDEEFITGSTTITMDTPGFAVITMDGSDDGVIVNPRITNTTNGSSVRIRKTLTGAHRHFVINGLYRTMKDENGNNIEQYSEGDYIYLEEGENILIYTADNVIPH